MSQFAPKVNEPCQMIYTSADNPQWINCLPKAASADRPNSCVVCDYLMSHFILG